ncbi:MAG: hypothetical protein JW860_14545, partial [Sedimentisphaerales bacterium]|nr:hypothetical protein [Sedimentisphaerales bacterium]
FSLFAQKKDLIFDEEPIRGKNVSGGIRVEILDQQNDLLLVYLPQPTFENGQVITVKSDQIKSE